MIREFFDDFTKVRILASKSSPLSPHAYFAAAVTTKNESVLNQRDLQRLSRGRNRSGDSRVSTSDHNNIEFSLVFGRGRKIQELIASGSKFFCCWFKTRIITEQDCIASSVESRQIMQC